MTNLDLNDELEVLTYDIERLETRRDHHLRAPHECRRTDQNEWHRMLLYLNWKLSELRRERIEILLIQVEQELER